MAFEDSDWDAVAYTSTKPLPRFGIEAAWQHAPTQRGGCAPDDDHGEVAGERLSSSCGLLGEVPAIAYSEVMRELVPRAPARKAVRREKISTVERISKLLSQLARSAEVRHDAMRSIERLGEPPLQTLTLVGTGP